MLKQCGYVEFYIRLHNTISSPFLIVHSVQTNYDKYYVASYISCNYEPDSDTLKCSG